MTEAETPLAVRRTVCFCEAVYERTWTVEDVRAERIHEVQAAYGLWEERTVPVLVDPGASCAKNLKPDVVIDAILAKKNLVPRWRMHPCCCLGPRVRSG